MSTVPHPPAPPEPEDQYNHIVDYYAVHDEPEHPPGPAAALMTLRNGTMNGQGLLPPRQGSLTTESFHDLPSGNRSLMHHANRSTPALPTHPRDMGHEPPLPHHAFAPPPSFDPSDLPFNAMALHDPIPRSSTSMSYGAGDPRVADPIPRSGTSMSNRRMPPPRGASAFPPHGVPPHQWRGPPPPPAPGPANPDGASVYSAGGYSNRSSDHYEGLPYDDHASVYSGERGGYGHAGQYGHYPPHAGPSWQGQPYMMPQDDGMYSAASHAGLDLPPGAPPPPNMYVQPPQGAPYYPPGPGPSDGFLSPSQSTPMRGPSAASINTEDADDFQMRPSLQRAGTTMSVAPNTKKTKAIDASQLPYTKEFVDSYRARMKEDPDPEAHFNYAKYLIEAAKKIGADAQDQRSVRKYRDNLIAESLKVIRKLATTGETGWYLTGSEGVLKQSDHEAYLWARKAANKGLSKAEYAVGYYAEVGIGLKVDIEFAKRWYMPQGNKRAMARLTDLKRAGNRRAGAVARPTRAQANKEDCVIA
ncbi:hypothetical protein FRC07_000909 [Ceratobasidium sp. 392]|nr:hypothetical protein FRC07_000909 [Ceratobasidium sp. 392]